MTQDSSGCRDHTTVTAGPVPEGGQGTGDLGGGQPPVYSLKRGRTRSGFFATIRRRAKIVDVALILAVPVLLVGLFAVSPSTKMALALAYQDPTLLTVFASHFVHMDLPHLLANLGAYMEVVPLVYVLSLLSGHRRRFLVAFGAFVLAFPFVLSGLNLLIPRPSIGYGFSGIATAFVGLLAVTLGEYASEHFGEAFEGTLSPGLFAFAAGIIAIRVAPSVETNLVILGLGVIGALLVLGPVRESSIDSLLGTIRRVPTKQRHFDLAALGVLIVLLFPFVAVPGAPVLEGTVPNVYTHTLGFCLGYLVPYSTHRVLGISF